MSMRALFLIYLIWGFSLQLSAEIQKVTISWNNVQCNQVCGQLAEKGFRDLKGVSEVHVNAAAGNAELIWKPEVPYDYTAVHYAMAKFGLFPEAVRMQLRGTISHLGKKFFITSIGDGTKVELLGTLDTSPNQYVIKFNAANYTIKDETLKKLLEAEARRQVVTIEGPLLEPWRAPLRLIFSSIDVDEIK